MKHRLFTLLFFVTMSAGTLFAERIAIDGLCYLVDDATQTAIVTYASSSDVQGNWNGYFGATVTTVTIPETVTEGSELYGYKTYRVVGIDDRAFENCKKLTSVTIPSSVKSVGASAFRDCVLLNSIQLGDSVTTIGNYAFYNCSSLTYINLPGSLTTIGMNAFTECSSLAGIHIPDNVTSIDMAAFMLCTNLEYVWLPSGLSKLEDQTFWKCTNLQQINIPLNMTEIGLAVFYQCALKTIIWQARNCPAYDFGTTEMDEITFGDSVEMIPNNLCRGIAFAYPMLRLPSSVKVIGDSAFFQSNIAYIDIGTDIYAELDGSSQLDSIGKDAFSYNTDLQEIVCWATTPPALGEHVFDGITCSNVHLKVPYKCERGYKAADQWKKFFIELINPPSEYTITFLNWDHSLLQEVQTPVGEMPKYTAATPTHEPDEEFQYTFDGWKPQIVPATADAIYVAHFAISPLPEGVEDTAEENLLRTKEIRGGKVLIRRGDKTYTVQGQEVTEP